MKTARAQSGKYVRLWPDFADLSHWDMFPSLVAPCLCRKVGPVVDYQRHITIRYRRPPGVPSHKSEVERLEDQDRPIGLRGAVLCPHQYPYAAWQLLSR